MTLTWRDGAATLIGGAALAVYMAVTHGWGWVGISSYRTGALVLGGLGLTMCIVGGKLAVDEEGTPSQAGTLDIKNPWIGFASLLGTGAFALTIAGAITGSTAVFEWLGIDIIVLWALTTLRHTMYGLAGSGRGAHPVH